MHQDKIIKKSFNTQNKEWAYEVSWRGFTVTTMEPKENIPRVLVELFERYGDSTIPIEIVKYSEMNGINCVLIKANDDILCLPACGLELNEDAYLIETPIPDSCNTEKTKCRFYNRSGGILVMGKPCGIVVGLEEIFGGESVTQVAELIEGYLQNTMRHKVLAG